MIPPRGFKAEQYPLRHRLLFSAGLSHGVDTTNTVYFPVVMSSTDMDVQPSVVEVNPHNPAYEEDAGPLVRQMSIIDKLNLSIKFNLTEHTNIKHETSAGVFQGDGIKALKLLWRPIFGSFTTKLDASDDDTGQTVATILSLTHDVTNEDVVPVTTNKLSVVGGSDLALPVSTVNAVQVFGDFNMTTNTTMEDHVWDENLLQNALRRFTNKGAIRSMIGRTRHLTLTSSRPYKNYFISKFVPRAIRRVMPFSFLGIQIHVPLNSQVEQVYHATTLGTVAHVGVKMIANYHEWNPEHNQAMGDQT